MKRIDLLLVEKNLARSRTEAQKLIAADAVQVCEKGVWRKIGKPSEKCHENAELKAVVGEEQKYVSRAGLKLEAALQHTSRPIEGTIALDIGQSTGGFTDCLLQLGAAHVVGIEVGRDQLVPALVHDSRVTTLEQYNARNLVLDDLPAIALSGVDLVVMDVSFISQHLILPRLPGVIKPGGTLVSLVKPQFEAGKALVGKNGIIRDEAVYPVVEQRIREHLAELQFVVEAYLPSPITGGDGNREFLVIARFDNNHSE